MNDTSELKKWMNIAEGIDDTNSSNNVVKNEYGTFYFKSAGNNLNNGFPIRTNLHRKNGPAAVWADGTEEWFIDGVKCKAQGPKVKEEMLVPKSGNTCDCNKWNCYTCFPKDADTQINTNEGMDEPDSYNRPSTLDFNEPDLDKETVDDIMALQDAGLSNSDAMYSYEELMRCSHEELQEIISKVANGTSTPGADNMDSYK